MSKWFWYRILIVLLFFNALTSYASVANFTFGHISLDQRLPGSSVHCVYQDKKGLIWLAIESVGLCKYDGENFTVYEKSDFDSNTISNNFPLCIVEDSTGTLWIGTTEGLNEFDRKKGIFKRHLFSHNSKNCIPNNYITDLHVDRYNNIWIGTRKGVSKYIRNQDKFCNFLIGEGKYTDGLPAFISTFYEDIEGNIWIGSYSSGLFLINHDKNLMHNENGATVLTISKHWFPILNEKDSKDNYAIQEICIFDNNTLLLGKIDGLYLFNIKTEEFSKYNITLNSSINNSSVSSMYRDKSGMIWVGYSNKGLVMIDPKYNLQYYFDANLYLPHGIKSNSIRDIYEDKAGLIWIATKFQGINTYDKRQEIFNSHNYNTILFDKIDKKFILSLMEDSMNNIWIGTKNHGIFFFNPHNNKIINFTINNSKGKYYIDNNRIECLIQDVLGNVWAGTENGVKRLDSNSLRFIDYDDYFIRCIETDKRGNLWIGTNTSGLLYYDVECDKIDRYKSLKNSTFFKDNNFGTRDITITNDSLLWISTFQNGLFKYDIQNDLISHYVNEPDDSTSISGNMVRGLYEDNNGKIWIGTKSNGLNIYNNKSDDFNRIPKINGLPPNTIYCIEQDDNNNYWMGSHEGLNLYNSKNGENTLYNQIYGLKNNIYAINAKCVTSNGLMIFGGSNGLNVFNPNNVYKKEFDASLLISSVKVYDKVIAEDINEYIELSVSYSEKYISIGFALTEYSDPLKITYKYKLENFDDDWVDCGIGNNATYTSLPPGEYYFKVRASNSENDRITKPLSIKLNILSPFWRKSSFIAISIIFILIIAIILHIIRLRFLRKNEIKLKYLVETKTRNLLDLNKQLKESKEKAEESDKLKSAFLANMSHEIRTPMNGIIGFTDLLIEPELTGENQKKYVGIIQKSGRRMLRIINDIIEISKLEAGQIIIQKEEVFVNPIIDELFCFFEPELKVKGISFIASKELDDKAIIYADGIRITQVLSNLIHNAIKFTEKGQISFGYIKKENCIEFFVRDSGIGISSDIKDLIFERFRQAESISNFSEGSGLGLSISKALLDLHGGKIWVESEKGKGSTFFFNIPCKDLTYSKSKPD